MFQIAVICLVITALLAYVNARFVRLPTTIGVMAVAMLLSLGLIGLKALGVATPHVYEQSLLRSIDFTDVLMEGMLSFLLFIFWIGIAPAAYFALMDSTVAQMVTNIVSSGALAMP